MTEYPAKGILEHEWFIRHFFTHAGPYRAIFSLILPALKIQQQGKT